MTTFQTTLAGQDAQVGEDPDDALARTAIQDAEAFAALHRRHVERVYRFLLARSGSVQDAEDLTAQTFMAAMDSLRSYRGEARFTTWLIGIARNKAANHLRKRSRSALSLDVLDSAAAPGPALDDLAGKRARFGAVLGAMQRLAPDRAEALALRFFGELSTDEIGRVMGRSEAAVRMLVHRGLADLRAMLSDEEYER